MNLEQLLLRYEPTCEQEACDRRVMLNWYWEYPDTILTRRNEFAHFTSSSMIFDLTASRVLMAYHNIYQSWAWTGGHADGDEDLYAVAVREAQEETGIQVLTPVCEDPVSLDILTVNGHVKRGAYVSSHLHLSVCYAFTADPAQALSVKPDENSGVKWIPIDRLEDYVSEPVMMPIYRKIIRRSLERRNAGI